MSLSVYIAGPYRARAALKDCAEQLTAIGYDVTARWLSGDHEGAPDAAAEGPIADRQRWAREDCQDVTAAQVLVAFTAVAAWRLTESFLSPPTNFGASGGRHIETGYAIATDRKVVLVGEPENVFHWLPQVQRCADWTEALVWLAAHLVDHERNLPRMAATA